MARWSTYTSYSWYFDGSDMTKDETEFLLAVASYQKRFDRRYPTWLEVLNILRCLGYRKTAEPVPICEPIAPTVANPEREFEEAPPKAPRSEFEIMKAKFQREAGEPGAPATG